MIDEVFVDSDEAGFSLVLVGDFVRSCEAYLAGGDVDRLVLRLPQDAALQLLAQARSEIGPWAAGREIAYRDWQASRVAGGYDEDCGYDPRDPKHPRYLELVSDADLARKLEKGE